MQYLILFIQRFISPNPILFKGLAILSGVIAIGLRFLFFTDGYLEFVWLSDSLSGLLGEIEVGAWSVFGTSQLTTRDKGLQHDTDKMLKK